MRDETKHEEPTFQDVAMFYNYVFDLGTYVDPTEAARTILKADYALSLSNYITERVELAAKFHSSLKAREQALQLTEFSFHLKVHGLKGAVTWILRHPRQSVSLWRVYRERPRSADKPDAGLQESVPIDFGSEVTEMLTDAVSELDQSMAGVQTLASLQIFSDRRLFSELYLGDVPFVRLELQSLYATIEGDEHEFTVSLLIHRTGVAILSLYSEFARALSYDEVIRLQMLGKARVTRVKIPDALMATQAIASGFSASLIRQGLAKQTDGSKEQWCEFEIPPEETYTLRDVIEWYRMSILSSVLGKEPTKPKDFWNSLRTPDWFAYPIIFIKGVPGCATDEDFKGRYSGALAGLVLRLKQWRVLKPERIQEEIKRDHSLSPDKSVYIGASHSVVLYYSGFKSRLIQRFGENIPSHEWLFIYFQTSGLIDVLLIERWILHILRSELHKLPYGLKGLNSLRRNLLLALSEYHDITVSNGSSRETIEASKSVLGINDAYDGVRNKLSSLEKLIDVEESLRRYRRDLFLRFVVTIGTLLFGLSGAKQVVAVVSSWHPVGSSEAESWFINMINHALRLVRSHPDYSTLALYLCLVILVLPALLWSVWPSRSKVPIVPLDKSRAAYSPSFVWPVPMSFRSGNQEQTERVQTARVEKESE